MACWKKRGQNAAGAAIFLAVVTGLMIAFIIAIPPSERAELLGESSSSSSSSSNGSTTSGSDFVTARSLENVLNVNPGRIDFLAQDQIDHPLPVVNVFTATEAQVLAEANVIVLKRGVFTNERGELDFRLDSLMDTEDLLLNFNVETGSGELKITVNERELFNGEILNCSRRNNIRKI